MSGGPHHPSRAAGAGGSARTIFLGSGGFGAPILEALLAAPEVEIVAVVGAPDRAAGRGGPIRAAPVVALARGLGLPVLQPPRLRGAETLEAIGALEPALGVLADYGRIVPPDLLELPPHGILNVHPSLLPRHRGAAPIPAVILAGDTHTGVTVIKMDPGIDTGPIVAQSEWPLDGGETAPGLEARAATEGASLLLATVAPWLAGLITPRQQDEATATLTRPLRREDGRLDPHRSVSELERRVRALQPWPGCWLETVVGRVTVWRAEPVPGFESAEATPGRFGRFGLWAADGQLALREVQPAGGRRMTWDELVRGRPAIVGSAVIGPA